MPHPLPQHAPHLFERARREGYDGQSLITTINYDMQLRANRIAYEHYLHKRQNHINNIAILVCETKSGNVLAYTGNIYDISNKAHGTHVDIITSYRSPGSLLKPFLYAAMLSDGYILPNTLVPDIPTNFKGFSPENFNRTHDGAVPASRALSRSLNIPAVKMLQEYSPEKFLDFLKAIGFTSFTKSANHYGLSIILGGAEVSLWEITGKYASLGRILLEYRPDQDSVYSIFKNLSYLKKSGDAKKDKHAANQYFSLISPGAAYHTIISLKEVNRPDEDVFWRDIASQFPVAWKTGTSYGNRDAWAIGLTPEFTVGVWVGNASGEGRPDLTGINAAAPILFDVFKSLRPSKWFTPPYDDMNQVAVCRFSGHRVGQYCSTIDTLWIQNQGLSTLPCPYHKLIHLDQSEKYRVNTTCESISDIVPKAWFVLPPVQEFYFRQKNPFYKQLPPYRVDCIGSNQSQKNMELIYPPANAKIFIPLEIDGTEGEVVFKLAHRDDNANVYWHVNREFIATTSVFHEISLRPAAGIHVLTIVDESGETITRNFEVISRK